MVFNLVVGRGPDIDNPSNLNINDVLGDYSLTLIDSLDTLAVMGNITEFKKAVKLVVDNVSFDKPYTVQVSNKKHIYKQVNLISYFTVFLITNMH